MWLLTEVLPPLRFHESDVAVSGGWLRRTSSPPVLESQAGAPSTQLQYPTCLVVEKKGAMLLMDDAAPLGPGPYLVTTLGLFQVQGLPIDP